ncbi:MAG: Multidrug resistance protein MdtA [Chlamydiae bacterium]|nr:Multidrug resistance protein MdtA [Chlamydiota bacterium]
MKNKQKEKFIQKLDYQQILNLEIPKGWLLICVILGSILAILIWSFFGKIPIQVNGKGVFLSSKGAYVIRAKASGTVEQIFVKEMQEVKKGDALLEIDNPKIQTFLTNISTAQFSINKLQQGLVLFQNALEIGQRLYKEGLIAKMTLDQTQTNVYQQQISIENAQVQLDLAISELNANAYLDYDENLDISAYSFVKSHENIKILEVLVNKKAEVDRKEALIWAEEIAPPYFYCTIPADSTNKVEEGMHVIIEPVTVNSQEKGAMLGKIKKVYPFPVSTEELYQMIGNLQIVNYLAKDLTSFIIVEPVEDLATVSGYKWTSEKGPKMKIPSGTLADVKIVVENVRPISYLIPIWKFYE